MVLGDAHCLPVKSSAVDIVLSIAMLEHVWDPFLTLREVCRVLRPGGLLVGTVAFLEPHHSSSYFHLSHMAVAEVLRRAHLEVIDIAADANWTVLEAHFKSSLFPGLPNSIKRAIMYPLRAAHLSWWAARGLLDPRFSSTERLKLTAAAFRFVASKPEGYRC